MSIDIKLNIPALEKLMDYSASGIGSVAGPMLVSWKARQEAKAKAITAKGEVEAERIVTEGHADTMKIIAVRRQTNPDHWGCCRRDTSGCCAT